MKYLVVVEDGGSSFGADVPDLPGCIAVGANRAEALGLIHDAIDMHLESLRERGEAIRLPQSSGSFIEVHA